MDPLSSMEVIMYFRGMDDGVLLEALIAKEQPQGKKATIILFSLLTTSGLLDICYGVTLICNKFMMRIQLLSSHLVFLILLSLLAQQSYRLPYHTAANAACIVLYR